MTEKLYYLDSHIHEFSARVLSCEKAKKGFAVTLFIGVLASMISSVFITRFLLRQAAGLGIKNTKLWAR